MTAERSDFDQLILPGADAQFFRVLQTDLPVGVGVDGDQGVPVAGAAAAGVVHHGAGQAVLSDDRVGAGLIQRHRINGGKHPHIRHDRGVVFAVAVAVGGDVPHQRHMEAGPALHHGLGVLRDLFVQQSGGGVAAGADGVLG